MHSCKTEAEKFLYYQIKITMFIDCIEMSGKTRHNLKNINGQRRLCTKERMTDNLQLAALLYGE